MMIKFKNILKSNQRKFFLYSIVGIVLILLSSALTLYYHNKNVSGQVATFRVYSAITKILTINNEIVSIAGKLEGSSRSIDDETVGIIEDSLDSLKSQYHLINFQLLSANFNTSHGRDEKKKLKSDEFLNNHKVLLKDINDLELFLKKTKALKNENARKRLIQISEKLKEYNNEVLFFLNDKILSDHIEEYSKLRKAGFILVFMLITQILLIWLLIFRPLFKTISQQHDEITKASLNVQSANRSKSDFIANISHEIRTPMTGILGYTAVLRDSNSSNQEKDEAVKIIDRNAEHLMGIIDEILDISKLESGKFDYDYQVVELPKLIDDVYALVKVKAEEKNIDLIFTLSGKIPKYIKIDPKRFKQILFNVVGNAVKFTNEGYVHVKVLYNLEEAELMFLVRDTGIGIELKNQGHLFKYFEQVDSSVSRNHGGTGLGLVLSKDMAEGMRGDVNLIRSEINKGSVFEISFQLEIEHELILTNQLNLSENGKKEFKQTDEREFLLEEKRIMIVDDAKENSRLFEMYLKKAGAETVVHNNGVDAISSAAREYFDLILLDLQMPGKDGFQVLKELRSNLFDGPIVALTAHTMEEEKIRTKEAGFDEHLSKPIKPRDLINKVFELIE